MQRKSSLDYDFDIKKRRAVLAEEVLADFYQARDIIQGARHPGGYTSEGSTRPKTDWETDRDVSLLDSYYRTTERLLAKADFFAQLHAKRYRFLALFGPNTESSFDEIFKVRHEMNVGVHVLIMNQRNANLGIDASIRERMEARIWNMEDADDPITVRLNQSVQGIETICQPIIQDSPR